MKGKCRREESKFGREVLQAEWEHVQRACDGRVLRGVARVDKWELMGRDSGSVVCGVDDGMEHCLVC